MSVKEWDLVFTVGKHTDSNGNTRVWTESDLDNIVARFNPGFHEPPLVIGHPSDNAPAFGWVEAIKRIGTGLYVLYKDVAPEFRDWAAKRLFKKKSIALYPDGMLRHVGYLGATPPAIKGLPDFAFADNGRGTPVTVEFSDWRMTTIGSIVMRIRDYLVEKEGVEKAETIIRSWEVQDLLTPPPEPDNMQPVGYHEPSKGDDMDLQALTAKVEGLEASIKTFTEGLAAFGEAMKAQGVLVVSLQNELKTSRDENLRREFSEFLTTDRMARRIPEGSRAATLNHLMSLVTAPAIEFGEGDQKTTVSAVDDYKASLEKLPEIVAFGEHATHGRAVNRKPGEIDSDAVASKAREFQESEAAAGRTVSMTVAVAHVMAEEGGKK